MCQWKGGIIAPHGHGFATFSGNPVFQIAPPENEHAAAPTNEPGNLRADYQGRPGIFEDIGHHLVNVGEFARLQVVLANRGRWRFAYVAVHLEPDPIWRGGMLRNPNADLVPRNCKSEGLGPSAVPGNPIGTLSACLVTPHDVLAS